MPLWLRPVRPLPANPSLRAAPGPALGGGAQAQEPDPTYHRTPSPLGGAGRLQCAGSVRD